MSRNYLLDEQGDLVNTLLAAPGFNLRKMLQRLKGEALNIFAEFIRRFFVVDDASTDGTAANYAH